MGALNPVVILSTADFDAAVWTNKQHIASRLSDSHEVIYINSLGLRAPNLNKSDLLRILKRLVGRFSRGAPPTTGSASVNVVSPKVLPWHGYRIIRALNKLLLLRVWRNLPNEFDLWTFSPLTYGLEARARKVIYQSVDLLHEFDRVPREVLLSSERDLVKVADCVLASSRVIADHLRSIGARDVGIWENVADTELFARYARNRVEPVPRSGVVFAGNLTASKVDFEILVDIASAGYPLYLVGPMAIDGTKTSEVFEDLLNRSNVNYLGNLPQNELAALFARCCVGVIPYELNEYTQGVFPMKVHEYRSAGLRVVSTKLPSLAEAEYDGLVLAESIEFVQAVKQQYDLDPLGLTDEQLGAVSWERRLSQVRETLHRGAPDSAE